MVIIRRKEFIYEELNNVRKSIKGLNTFPTKNVKNTHNNNGNSSLAKNLQEWDGKCFYMKFKYYKIGLWRTNSWRIKTNRLYYPEILRRGHNILKTRFLGDYKGTIST